MSQVKFEIIKLTDRQAQYLTSVVVPRWVRNNERHAAHIWFEVFLEQLETLGYTIVKKDVRDEK